jgi:hypothetical protein
MATKKSFKTRRKIVKRKKALPKIVLVGGAIAGGYLLYTNIIKPYLDSQKNKDLNNDVNDSTNDAIQTVVTTADNTTPNVTGGELSPMGTSFNNLKFNTLIKYGMKGEEVKRMQNIFNNLYDFFISQGWKPKFNKVVADGVFGPNTWNEHKKINFNAQTLQQWLDDYKRWQNEITAQELWGSKGGAGGSW